MHHSPVPVAGSSIQNGLGRCRVPPAAQVDVKKEENTYLTPTAGSYCLIFLGLAGYKFYLSCRTKILLWCFQWEAELWTTSQYITTVSSLHITCFIWIKTGLTIALGAVTRSPSSGARNLLLFLLSKQCSSAVLGYILVQSILKTFKCTLLKWTFIGIQPLFPRWLMFKSQRPGVHFKGLLVMHWHTCLTLRPL